MSDRRRYTRPRTKVYDANYTLGENYYRSALDGLDRKYGKLPTETIDAPRRPISVGDFDSLMSSQATSAKSQQLQREMDDEMESTLRRIQKARMGVTQSAEESFDNAFFNRREEVKRNYSEKMLDSVGLSRSGIEEDSIRRRRAMELEMDTPKISEKWTAMRNAAFDSLDESAASARARASKARLADIESEMDEIAERGAAREKRLVGLRRLLEGDSEDLASSASSMSLRKKVTTITEKRVI